VKNKESFQKMLLLLFSVE